MTRTVEGHVLCLCMYLCMYGFSDAGVGWERFGFMIPLIV